MILFSYFILYFKLVIFGRDVTKNFIESIDQGIWDAIINGPCTPKHIVDDLQVNKSWTQWNEEKRRKAQYDCNAKNILTSSLTWMSFFVFRNTRVPRKCGRFLK